MKEGAGVGTRPLPAVPFAPSSPQHDKTDKFLPLFGFTYVKLCVIPMRNEGDLSGIELKIG